MSLILRPNTVPDQAAAVPARASAPRDEPAQLASPSFDEVLVRSLGAGLETTDKIAPKAVASAAARRPSVAHQDDPAELANAIAMTLVGLDGGGVKTSAGEHRPGDRADPPASLSEGAAPEALAQDSAALAGTARRPGLPVASAAAALNAKSPGSDSDHPAATLADPAPAATSDKADHAIPGDAASANNQSGTVAMNADPTAALAASMLPLARPVGAGTPAPDAAAAQGTKQRPGLRIEPAMTTSRASSAAATVAAVPASAGLDGLPPPARAPQTRLAAASDKPAPMPAATSNTAQGPAPDARQADSSLRDDEKSLVGASPALAMNADSTAALTGSMLPIARPAGADTPAPDSPAAQGTTQRPGLRVEPAMTTSSAAGTVSARPASAGPDNGLPVPALATGQQSPGQVTQTEPAAAGDQPTLAPAAASSAAQRLVADAGQTDWSSRNQAESTDSLQPAVARPGDPATAVATPLPSIDAHAAPAIAAAATTPLAARTPRQGVTVKAAALSAVPHATVPGSGGTPLPALKAGKTALAGDSDDTSQPTPPALSAGASEQAAPPLAADSFASQALGPDPAAPAADALGAGTPALLHPLPAAAAGATGHAAASHSGELPYAPRLSPEVGSKEWNQALGQQVLQLGQAGQQVTELQLNPPGLGPMQVTLQLNQHQMQVMFVSAHASVRAAVEAAMPQLRASLADSGISLGQAWVSSESQAQSAFAQQQQSAARQQAYRNHSLPEPAAVNARALAGVRRGGTGRGVDTYA